MRCKEAKCVERKTVLCLKFIYDGLLRFVTVPNMICMTKHGLSILRLYFNAAEYISSFSQNFGNLYDHRSFYRNGPTVWVYMCICICSLCYSLCT